MNTKKKIRLMVVDDSLTIRKHIISALKNETDIIIIAEATDGKDAVIKARELKPDVILMDMIMPVMDGLQAVEYFMEHQPIPIIIHSASKEKGVRCKIWDAISAGALDTVNKEEAKTNPLNWKRNIIMTIKAAARMRCNRKQNFEKTIYHSPFSKRQSSDNFNLVAFGVSTGGPAIIARILKLFPNNFPLPIILVIHMASTGTETFPEWLSDKSNRKVEFAKNQMNIIDYHGIVLIAPHNHHIQLNDNRIKIFQSNPVNYCMPSIDVLFFSLSNNIRIKPIAVLLSGMGNDGAKGLKAIKESGGYTICQDQATSTVFGMPKAAIDMKAETIVLPDIEIPQKICSLIGC